jgi:hypothetical protein
MGWSYIQMGKLSFLRNLRTICRILCIGSLSATSVTAQAPSAPAANEAAPSVNLNITPKRLVLDRGTRVGTVYIFNQGNVATTFEVTFVERVMLPDGQIKPVSEAASDAAIQPFVQKLQSAQPFLAATPRRVTLAPGKGQTIRIRSTQPDSNVGEYRSHLTVTSLPPREAGLTADQVGAERGNQLSFRITSSFGISIPVILRTAPKDVKGALANVAVSHANLSSNGYAPANRTPVLTLDIQRLGASSLYGNVEVRSGGGKGGNVIGKARGVGVYPEIAARRLMIPLDRLPSAGENLQITFSDDDSAPGQIIAKTVFHVR